MKRRILSALLAFAMVLALLPGTALAAEDAVAYPVTGGSIYFDKSTGAVTGCDRSVTAASIPGEIAGVAVTSIGSDAFYGCSSLTSIDIPDGVTRIGIDAFWGCRSLTSIHIPDGVTSIGYSAFADCSSLTSIHIPDGVTIIGSSTFFGCSSLTSIHIPDGVISIGDGAFKGCSSLASIHIPDSVTRIGDGAFKVCSSLTSITVASGNSHYSSLDGVLFDKEQTELLCYPAGKSGADYRIPDSVTSIGDSAFADCSSLTSIHIPDSVTIIWSFAFRGCSSLTSIHIPDSVTSIWSFAFDRCSSLTSITVASGNSHYSSLDGVLFDKEQTELLCYPAGKSGTDYRIPDGVTSIGSSAFYDCISLTSIHIPDGVTSIGSNAFWGCSRLTGIHIPDGVTSIGSSAFYDCISLTSIHIPDSVTSIGSSAFYDCSSLTSIHIPDSVTSIGSSAFYDCSSLRYVYYSGTKEQWESIEIDFYNDSLETATIIFNSSDLPDIDPDPAVYTVTFDANGGSGTMDPVKVADGTQYQLPACAFAAPQGKTFDRWEINGTPYDAGEKFTVNGNITVKATWKDATSPDPDPAVYTVTLNYGSYTGAPKPATYTVTANAAGAASFTFPANPDSRYEGGKLYSFGGWVSPSLPGSYQQRNTITVTADLEFTAKWVLASTGGGGGGGGGGGIGGGTIVTEPQPTEPDEPDEPWVNPFGDISSSEWYYDAVAYVTENGLMNGVGGGRFDPSGTTTRGQIVTILYRLESEPAVGASSFTDVASGAYYEKAIAWAASHGIVNGVGGGRFDPDGSITREQFAAILYRYASYKGYSAAGGSVSGYTDADSVSAYAKEAMGWANAQGLITGVTGSTLAPQGSAIRAQAATILMRFCQDIAK